MKIVMAMGSTVLAPVSIVNQANVWESCASRIRLFNIWEINSVNEIEWQQHDRGHKVTRKMEMPGDGQPGRLWFMKVLVFKTIYSRNMGELVVFGRWFRDDILRNINTSLTCSFRQGNSISASGQRGNRASIKPFYQTLPIRSYKSTRRWYRVTVLRQKCVIGQENDSLRRRMEYGNMSGFSECYWFCRIDIVFILG